MHGLLLSSCMQLILGAPPVAEAYNQGLSLVQVKVEERRASASQQRSECHAGKEELKHKVFVHSLPKTGTTSVGKALHLLGYKDCSWKPHQYFDHESAITKARKLVDGLDAENIPESTQEKVRSLLSDFKKDVDECQSFSDWPVGHASILFPLALKLILWPDGLFVWVNRPYDKWIVSLEAMKMDEFNETIDEHEMKEEYTALKTEAIRYHKNKPDQMYALNIEDLGWDPLVEFLFGESCSAPDIEFPVENARNSSTAQVELPSSAREDAKEQVARIPDNDPVSVYDYLYGLFRPM